MKTTYCSNCNAQLTATAAVNDRPDKEPGKGAISICWTCGQICVFEEDLSLRKISDEEMNIIKEKEPRVWQSMLAVTSLIKAKNSARNARKLNPINFN